MGKSEIQGGAGAPPPGAPQEVSQPLTPELIAQQLANARANERELAPLTYQRGVLPTTPPPQHGRPANPVDFFEAPAVARERAVDPPPAFAPPAQVVGSAGDDVPRETVIQRSINPHQPAASDSDTPSRGIPQRIHDAGKAITGGFGDLGVAEYFPLTGEELRDLVVLQMERLLDQMRNDLRFGMALTYPRVAVRLELHVSGFAEDQHFMIPKVAVPEQQTPLEVAQGRFDEVVFVLKAAHVEDGESATAPNAVRGQIGAKVPRKQMIPTGGGHIIADVGV